MSDSHPPPPRAHRPKPTPKPTARDKKHSQSHSYPGFSLIQKYTNLPLPDGTHRRKLDKIKATLIHKAKLTQSIRKIKVRTAPELTEGRRRFDELARLAEEEARERRRVRELRQAGREEGGGKGGKEEQGEKGEEGEWNGIRDDDDKSGERGAERGDLGVGKGGMHPDRIARRNREDADAATMDIDIDRTSTRRTTGDSGRERRPKPSAFNKSLESAALAAAEREQFQLMLASRDAERRRREAERERWRKAVNAKTRTGQVKLGKQSGLLLERIRREMGES